MEAFDTELPGVVLIAPRVFEDQRGFLMETFHEARFAELGIDCRFVQENHSFSRRGTLRGLHLQEQRAQGKLIRVVRGEIFDVAVDVRTDSETCGRWIGVCLNETNRRQLFVPPGYAHGFCVTSETAEVVYKCTDFYCPEHERTILWNDAQLGIDWPVADPLLSEKDRAGLTLAEYAAIQVSLPSRTDRLTTAHLNSGASPDARPARRASAA